MKQYQTQRVMLYFEIKQLLSDNFKISQISNKLSISRTTVYFYAEMSEEDFLEWVRQIRKKSGKLSAYENRIKDRLNEHPDLSSYQVHDWLLEHFPDLEVSRRTVSSFVSKLRQLYHIPKPTKHKKARVYMAVEDLPYGRQAQVDFGVYEMQDSQGQLHKVYFMIMVLSRSRYKHVYFLNRPFTSANVIRAHEEAFAYFGGVPLELVYDQDKLMVISENAGDILFTEKFSAYIKVRKFEIFLCHKSDPETKGKSESVVKYVKTNFLRNRLFINEEVINAECLAWLKRTGNGQVHGTTKRIPAEEFLIEKQHLGVLHPVSLYWLAYEEYHVRKDNLITWKSNRYSVPEGTYQGKGTKVWVKVDKEHLVICSEDKTPIARHEISLDRGMTIINSNHRRDRTQQIDQLMEEVGQGFTDKQAAQEYFAQLQQVKGRYIRDQLLLIKKAIGKSEAVHIDQALVFCQTNSIFNATDFIAVLNKTSRPDLLPPPQLEELLSKSVDRKQFSVQPQTSDITDYEAIVNSK
jgi:transposase